MSDIRKFINIVESVFEDDAPADVGKTEADPSEKMSNQERMVIALHNLVILLRFIKNAQEHSRRKKSSILSSFVNRADIFIKEAHELVNEVSGKDFVEPNIRELINGVNVIKPYDSTPVFRTKKGQFGPARSSNDYINEVIELIEKGINLIAFDSGGGDANKAGFLFGIMNLLHVTEFARLNNVAKKLIPDIERDLEKISNP